jgi:hypothetical protein
MFSEAGDLQSNVQSTDADIIFTPYLQANQQLLQNKPSNFSKKLPLYNVLRGR